VRLGSVNVPDQDPSGLQAPAVPDSGIGAVLVSSRSLAEYRAMLALSDADLRRRLLDCPGGAASLTAEIHSAGGDAIACDPLAWFWLAPPVQLRRPVRLSFHRDGICELMRVTR
jgi:hypothetical protein